MPRASTQKSDDTEIVNGAGFAALLAKVIAIAPTLAKEGENRFAGYSYVPVDGYYEVLGKLLAKHGVTFVTREVSCDLVEVVASAEKKGRETQDARPRTFVKATFVCDAYVAGEDRIEQVSAVTVFQSLTGPQTAGSMVSYAEKVFFRTLLKAVTGEADGDAEEPLRTERPVQSGPEGRFPGDAPRQEPRKEERREPPRSERIERQEREDRNEDRDEGTMDEGRDGRGGSTDDRDERRERSGPRLSAEAKAALRDIDGGLPLLKKQQQDWSVVVEIFQTFLPTIHDAKALREWWDSNADALSIMKEDAPEDHAKVRDAFRARNNALQQK